VSHPRYRSPHQGLPAWLENTLANAAGLRALRRFVMSCLPFPPLVSDVRDVIYASWAVPVEAVREEVPPGVALHQGQGLTLLTVLTYRHGHFGPRWLGPLRSLLPSPLQSNWRLYIDDARSTVPLSPRVVLFLRNVFDSALHAVGTRLFSDVLPSHCAGHFVLARDGGRTRIEIAGPGSAPAFALTASAAQNAALPETFRPLFADWAEAVCFICDQDAAVARVADRPALALSHIALPVDLTRVEPMICGDFTPSALLASWGVSGAPFCFRVPEVAFAALSDQVIKPHPGA
jgi:hypothetical protein